jgi:LysR family carnitine catabolism transcriptional activator
MNITIKQMQAFVAVAKSQSFAEASIQLHLSQPALSITIRNLERAIGGTLLARTTRSVSLTPEGKELYPVAKRLLEDWDSSLVDINNLFSLRRGKLDIAAMPTFASSLLPAILSIYRQQHPNINITVHDVIAENVVDMVRTSKVELGITFDPGDIQELCFEPLFNDEFLAVLPKNHHLLTKPTLTWIDIKDDSFITLQRPSSIRLMIDNMLEERDIWLAPTIETHQLASVGRMVVQGLGVSVVPAISADQMIEMGAECRPIKAPIIARRVGVLTRKRYPLSVANQALLETIKHWAVSTFKSNCR